jgi:hypothetical protein
MKKKNLLIFLYLILFATVGKAQYGNEWIVPGQTYYKFSTAQNGMYAVSKAQLLAAGVNVNQDPRGFQLWHRGVEQNILIKGETDGTFDDQDSLIFYGKMNDGTQDAGLYILPVYQPHQYYNLFNDTTAFFLTWVPTTSNKRMPTASISSSGNASYHMAEYFHLFTDDYSRGIEYGEAKQSYGDRGEGWCGSINGSTYYEDIAPIDYNTSGPSCKMEVMIVGRSGIFNRKMYFRITHLNGPDIIDSFPVFSQQDRSYYSRTFPASMLTSSIQIAIDPTAMDNNWYSVLYVKLTYPQNVSMEGNSVKIFQPATPSTPQTYTLNWSSPAQPVAYDYTDKNNIGILPVTLASGMASVFPPSGVTAFTVMQNDAYLTPLIKQVDLTSYSTTENYIIITHQKLWSASQEYADYRASIGGGSYSVLLTDVEKLYNVYGYGEWSPIGIKRFFDHQKANNPNIQSVFLIGKGLDLTFKANMPQFYRQNPVSFITNSDPNIRRENFIPPMGSPPTDIMYAMDAANRPGMAVGRLSAIGQDDILNYLDKVKVHEQLDSTHNLWRKKLIHLSGGEDDQITLFRSYVDGFKTIVENSVFGGKVILTYSKKPGSTTVDQVNLSDYVNAGLGYITFFGHSSYSVTEIDIGYATDDFFGYHNAGMYPMLMIDGCLSANVYNNYSLTEDWIRAASRGAILAMGVSDIGYTTPLRDYTDGMYRGMFDTDSLKSKSVGQVMKAMLRSRSFDTQTTHQMNLHGDPMLHMYNPLKPDYEISGDKETRNDKPELKSYISSYDGRKVTASSDSFAIGIPVKNFGLYDKDKYFIQVIRTVNGKEIKYKNIEFDPVRYVDTLFFPIKDNNNPAYYGLNTFVIKIDILDTIHEMDETNNTATIEYFMGLSGVTCLFPPEFSIVHDQPITFVAQATNLLIQQRPYYFELDVSDKFNTSFKKDTVVNSGSLAKWPGVLLKTNNNIDSTVYYWRVRYYDVGVGEDTVWATSSFIYIKDSPDGWSQTEAPQFIKDDQNTMYLDQADSLWKFITSSMHLRLIVYGNGTGNTFDSTLLIVGDVETLFPGYYWVSCTGSPDPSGTENSSQEFNGVLGIAFDKSTVQNYAVPWYGVCGRFPKPIVHPFYSFGLSYLETWLNGIPIGDYILIGSDGNAGFSSPAWATAKSILQTKFGAQFTGQLDDNEPYLLLAKAGSPTPVVEKHSDDTYASLSMDTTIYGRYNNGSIVSTRIGPATQWGNFYQTVKPTQGQDKYKFTILGENLDGSHVDTLALNLTFSKTTDGVDYVDLQNQINASTYPFIRLVCSVSDSSVYLDPPQLKKWQVIYHPSPEGTMDPFAAGLANYTIAAKDEGATICIPYTFENISNLPFQDSLYVKITSKGDGPLTKDTTFIVYKDTLKPGQSFNFNYCLNTTGLYGNVFMRTFVNPNKQPEQYYPNNLIETYFQVNKDKIPPVIDVTFDGVHIMDGDIVSPSPMINITLNDNSKYLIINDPNDISIFFRRPGSSADEQIATNNADIVRFGQSPGASNTFTIEYNPKNLPDGDYTIIVQGKDVNGNKSGQYYRVTFHVENASTISNFYPYPNPFSSSTRFVFTLTGAYIPDDLKIQIMTVTGKVVREITKEELGHIHIGNNKTDYAWNGTDEFGDKLANGVYLYRVIIKNKGDNFEHRNTAGDKAFKHDFGKLYILR